MLELLILLFIVAAIIQYGATTIGMGYGTTLAPILLIVGYEPLTIVYVILFSQFLAGSLAAFFHHKLNNMDLSDPKEKTALKIFAVTGVIGVVVSILTSISLPSNIVGAYIGITVMLVGLITMLNGSHTTSYSPRRLTLLGSIAAFNKGITGGGYSPITVTGQMMSGIKPRAAVAITALADGILCAAGIALYFFLAVPVDFILLIGITAGAIAAAPFAALTTKKLKHEYVKRLVGVSTFLIGLVTLLIVLVVQGA